MQPLAGAVIVASLIAHGLLLLYVQNRSQRVRTGRWWMLLAILFSLLSGAVYLLPTIGALDGYLVVLAQALTLIAYGALVIQDISKQPPRAWLIGGGLWFAALIVIGALGDATVLARSDWLVNIFTAPSAVSVIAFGGMMIADLALLSTIFYAFYIALLPEVANRALYWAVDAAVLLIATFLLISNSVVLILLGQPIVLIGLGGAVYAEVSFRVIDIRSQFAPALRTAIRLFIITFVIFIALEATDLLETRRALSFAALALVAAILYIPLRQLTEMLISMLWRGSLSMISPTEITRRYSQQISGTLELPALTENATRAINSLMRVRRSGLILVNSSDTLADLKMLPGEPKAGTLSKAGLLYRKFAEDDLYISQFDLEFDPAYKGVPANESLYFRETQMSAYAPIVFENVLIGLLACGPKISDAQFTPRDFELLTTMAHQTGAALRNARLVADLRTLNESITALNASLEGAKEQMERLDSVKTDFITIASHELRTPLAQVRGYTDIIDALNEQDDLDQDQMTGMVGNLRKASERMEELISAMLDVSQLDVNAMDLRFAQTSLESVMRMAIEPLTDAVKQRKLTLSARGLRGLPVIQADMQRLVQAFRNVVVNAIKFTPDGGKIDIKASLQRAEQPSQPDQLLITVSDTGVGINKENLELVFRKFYRGHDTSLHSTGTYKFMGAGPGLGLTIAQGVIEGHGGKIWAESPGHNMESFPGTVFYILLPVTPPEDAHRVRPFQMPEPVSKVATLMRSQV